MRSTVEDHMHRLRIDAPRIEGMCADVWQDGGNDVTDLWVDA